MAKTDNQTVKSSREKMRSRAVSRFPDRKFDVTGENGEISENAEELDNAVMSILEEQDATIAEYVKKNEALIKLMMSDPQSAEFINRWLETGDPRAALVEVFGDELKDLGTEEGRGRFGKQLTGWRERKAENDRLTEESDKNWYSFMERLDAWGDTKGISVEKKRDIGVRLLTIYHEGLTNAFTEDDFQMVLNALGYDEDVENARKEGIINGRNQKIEAQRRTRNQASAMPPSMAGGQGMRMPAPKQEEKERDVWDEID